MFREGLDNLNLCTASFFLLINHYSNLHFFRKFLTKSAIFTCFFRPVRLFFHFCRIFSGKLATTGFKEYHFPASMLCGKIDYKVLEVYHLAHNFVLHVYALCDSFPSHESNNLGSQLRRASVSLPLNIAEGSGCCSFRSFLNFLSFAYRSLLEIEAALKLCKDLKYINDQQHQETWEKFNLLIRKLYRYMEYVQGQADKRSKYRTQIEQTGRLA